MGFGGRRFHGSKKAVSAARERLNETGIFGGVAQRIAQALDCRVQAVVEVHKRVGRLEAGVQIFPGNDFAGALEKHGQNLKGLLLEANLEAIAAELPGAKVYLKDSKADNSVCGVLWHIGGPEPGSLDNNGSIWNKVSHEDYVSHEQ